jgi:preprotein translocase subunit SecE
MTDKLKFGLALLCVAVGIVGFYLLQDQPLILQVLSVLAGIAIGVTIAWFTLAGQQFYQFARDSVTEAKKVVWPSRKETMQMTAIIFAFVLVMAVVLWTTDKGLEWLLYHVVLGWK